MQFSADRWIHHLQRRPIAATLAFLILLLGQTHHGLRSETIAKDGSPQEPAGYRISDYRSPTPLTLHGATTVSSHEAISLWASKGAVFIDVMPRPEKPPNLPPGTYWRAPVRLNIQGSFWLPNTGYGVLNARMTAYFETQLFYLTGGDKTRKLLFYCLKDCWMSWNAAKRAVALGHTNVIWYPAGTDGWTQIGGLLVPGMPIEPDTVLDERAQNPVGRER